MRVTLAELVPNPLRDFTVDPVDPARVEMLLESIKADGFWGGVVCRRLPSGGAIQIAAGLHRVLAATRAGEIYAELFVSTHMDDAAMIRVYARENATQRGNSGTAQAGTVSSALKYLARAILKGKDSGEIARVFPTQHSFEQAQKELLRGDGVGRPCITEFLKDIPGVTEHSVRQQLGILKASGDYARIIAEVTAEIEAENADAIAAAERAAQAEADAIAAAAKAEAEHEAAAAREKVTEDAAEKESAKRAKADAKAGAEKAKADKAAATAESKKHEDVRESMETARKASAKASATPVTFDLKGVTKHIDNIGHLEAFKKCVTGSGIAPYLPVTGQAALAGHLVKLAKDRGVVLTNRFITDNIGSLIHSTKVAGRKLSKAERDKIRKHSWDAKARDLQHHFSRQASAMLSAALKLAHHDKTRPPGVTLRLSAEFGEAVKRAKKAIQLIERALG